MLSRCIIHTPCESSCKAFVFILKMVARIPFERAVVSADGTLQVVVFPADVIAYLCNSFVLRELFTFSKTKINITRGYFVSIGEAAPSRNP